MTIQGCLDIEDTTDSHFAVVKANSIEDERKGRIQGLSFLINKYRTAVANDTYPYVGNGELLRPEHRAILLENIKEFEEKLDEVQRQHHAVT